MPSSETKAGESSREAVSLTPAGRFWDDEEDGGPQLWGENNPDLKSPVLKASAPLRHHGGMDHSGKAAGGSRPAALYHDRKVRCLMI